MMLRKPKVEILKTNTFAPKYLAELEELLEKTESPELRRKIRREITNVRAGMAGEERILFELKNSPIDLVVLQDLYVESGELSAQIDLLVITSRIYVVIECKNLFGDLEINNKGEFIRTMTYGRNRVKEGIYSPITQNERHLHVIRMKLLEKGGLLKRIGTNMGFEAWWKPLVVLANEKTILHDRYAPKEIRKQIIRCDQLITEITRLHRESRELKWKYSEMREIGEKWLSRCSEHEPDYIRRFREADDHERKASCDAAGSVSSGGLSEESPAKPEVTSGAEVPVEDGGPKAEKSMDTATSVSERMTDPDPPQLCPRCGSQLVLRTATRGASAGSQFLGCQSFPRCHYILNIP